MSSARPLTGFAAAALLLLALSASLSRSAAVADRFAVSRCEQEVSRLDRRVRWLAVELSTRMAQTTQRIADDATDAGEPGSW